MIPSNVARFGAGLFRAALSVCVLTFVSTVCSMAFGLGGLILTDLLLISVVAAGCAPGRAAPELPGALFGQ